MTAPGGIDPSSQHAEPEAVAQVSATRAIEGRSLGQIAWMRLKRDKIAIAGAVIVLFLILVAIFAGVLTKLNGHPPSTFYSDQIDPNTGGLPKGRFGGVSSEFWFGVEPGTGRDLFSRIVHGARVSLLIAFLATGVAVATGAVLGVTAGYFGGKIDRIISSVMDILLAFPLLIFAIALVAVDPRIPIPGGGKENDLAVPRLVLLVIIIGGFSWPYVGRIVRGQTLSLREKEFIEAARSVGASDSRIVFKELLPNLVAPIIVYSTLIIPSNILFEAALSFLGVGVNPPTPTWGNMLSDAIPWYRADPTFMIIPGVALFITVLAFNLFGDGLRDALDPRGGR
ncbi:MAG TPA: ABC transporter permease [Mycobacteriales bacterium]|nr:ABC transporter permease [Mycobacteriales bacterium]